MSFSLIYLVLQVFHHMVLIFHSFKGKSINFRYTTSTKSSKRLPGSLLAESSLMSPFHNRFDRFGFLDMGLIYMFFRSGSDFGRLMGSLPRSLLKYNVLNDFQEVFQTTSKKSSRRLPGSLLTESSSISSEV
ncbi:hypothetical protein YC2023_098776 [Brassica napus]